MSFPSSILTLAMCLPACAMIRRGSTGALPIAISKAFRSTPAFRRFIISSLPTQYRSHGVSPSSP